MLAVGVIGDRRAGVTAPDFIDWRAGSRTLDLAAMTTYNANLTGIDEPERVTAARVTANYFTVLGVRPLLGRVFTPDEEPEGAPHVVVLTEAFWRNRLGADSSALSRTLTLDDVPYTIVGVMGAGAEALQNGENLWVPLALRRNEIAATGARFLDVVARLHRGVKREQAADELQTIAARLKESGLGRTRTSPPGSCRWPRWWWATAAARCCCCSARSVWCCSSPAPTWRICCWCVRPLAAAKARSAPRSARGPPA